MTRLLLFIFLCLSLFSCGEKEGRVMSDQQFSKVPASLSGMTFSNNIIENDTLNYYTFPYLYMGGGVAIGDINNDGLSDVFVTGNMVPNKLYLNKGNMKFEDISEKSNLNGDNRWYTGVTMVDINNDGWLDIYLCVSGKDKPGKNQLFINNKDNTFTEKAETFGLDDASASIQASFFDYNNDGLLDVFVANYPTVKVSQGNSFYKLKMDENKLEDSGHLYQNNGNGTFSDVTDQAGVRNFGLSLGLVTTDFNNDGWTDIYISNDFNVPDYFYLNQKDGTFKEVIKTATNQTSMFGMGTDAADFNNDGLIDILQVDMTPEDHYRSKTNMASMSPSSFWQGVEIGFHYQYMQNSLQINQGINEEGIPQFGNIARFAGLATTDWSWGALFIDLDNDGAKDVFITNGMKRDVNNNDVLAKFSDAAFFGDAEKDFKALPSQPLSNYVFQNKGDFKFSNTTKDWGLAEEGFSNGVAYGDLDNDGDIDLVINNLDAELSLMENKAENYGNQYLKVKLKGSEKNPLGIGARVWVNTQDSEQLQEMTLTRGFQSSVEPVLHFGLKDAAMIKEVKVLWPDQKIQVLRSQKSNQFLELDYKDALFQGDFHKQQKKVFKDISQKVIAQNFSHVEDKFNDFATEPLLPHKNSQMGPALCVGDVNNDGLEDFFIGNASGAKAQLFIQNSMGKFEPQDGPWTEDFRQEDTGALLEDFDNDGDLDLYVVSGGNDPMEDAGFFQDRLYINENGQFKKSLNSLPKMDISGQSVAASDFDHDGDLDLFVGGRIIPGKYPFPPSSLILRNEGGKNGQLKFTDVTMEVAPVLKDFGLVTSAEWADFDGDGQIDLIVAGEWTHILLLKNEGTGFTDVSEIYQTDKMKGWWYSLKAADLDNDGDLDFVAGNLGLNYKYKSSDKAPFEVYAHDFDENGRMDIVLSTTKKGKKLPLRGRECSSQQIPVIAKRFKTFDAFASANLADIYGEKILEKALHYQANTFAHYWLENKGEEGMVFHQLPNSTQLSSINAIEIVDYNGDEYKDILIAGNLYGSEVETPRNDASCGQVLLGRAGGSFYPLSPFKTGLLLKGEVKKVVGIRLENQPNASFLVGRNNQSLQVFQMRLNPL
ncbi:VCBS repeat-containing protein [Flexithrix dorotheae]|uniref:VCBS repeat-containing protein n=1 Tax=Flexithrix dorotheae TaxID=70993 RepID=UPI0005C4B1D9|nr:VCBS repeat-containing protein [Flexithrix dorotheae]